MALVSQWLLGLAREGKRHTLYISHSRYTTQLVYLWCSPSSLTLTLSAQFIS